MTSKLGLVIALFVAFALAAAAQTEQQDLTKQWSSLRDATLNTAKAMPDDKYSFRPGTSDPSFAELLVKMADAIDSQFADISGQKSPFVRPETLGPDTVKKLVSESFDYGANTIGDLKDTDAARAKVLAAFSEAAAARGQAEAYIKAKDMVSAEEADRRKFLFYGFVAAWLLVCIYVVAISLRERKLRGELDRVKRLIEGQNKAEQARL